jgi:hypothetical protein
MTYRFYVPIGVSEDEARSRLQERGVEPGKYFWYWTRWCDYQMTGWGFFVGCRILDDYKAYSLWTDYMWVQEDGEPVYKYHLEIAEWSEENGP